MTDHISSDPVSSDSSVSTDHISTESLVSSDRVSSDSPKVIGMLAGWGTYPVRLAQVLKNDGYTVYCLGVRGHCSHQQQLQIICDQFFWTSLGKFGQCIRILKRLGVKECIMLGKIHKKELYKPWKIYTLLPDWLTIKTFAAYFLFRNRSCQDDSLLLRIVELFAEHGIHMGEPTSYAPQLLVKEGLLTQHGPTELQWLDILFGWQVARELGRMDIGQTAIVKGHTVIAAEAIEGTDLCIQRAGELVKNGKMTMVKVAKPAQDMRFDVPAVGLHTVRNLIRAGVQVLAIEADRTIIVDQDEVVELADKNGLVIIALAQSNLPECFSQWKPIS